MDSLCLSITHFVLLKGEMEMKRGCDSKRTLYYLTKAVQLNDYDESALVVRSRLAILVNFIF